MKIYEIGDSTMAIVPSGSSDSTGNAPVCYERDLNLKLRQDLEKAFTDLARQELNEKQHLIHMN